MPDNTSYIEITPFKLPFKKFDSTITEEARSRITRVSTQSLRDTLSIYKKGYSPVPNNLKLLFLEEMARHFNGQFILSGGFAAFCLGKTSTFTDIDYYMVINSLSEEHLERYRKGIHEVVKKACANHELSDILRPYIKCSSSYYNADGIGKVIKLMVGINGNELHVADLCLAPLASYSLFPDWDVPILENLFRGEETFAPLDRLMYDVIYSFDISLCKSLGVPVLGEKNRVTITSIDISGVDPPEQWRQLDSMNDCKRKQKYMTRVNRKYFM
uniref:Uncharacterized protein n=1 Tax=Trachysalambria curvirostris nimavirus TaxID=2984282 RepID=A0A9C7EZ27_9VIRU|nr:MAG: hypothetical protein [Trachysalambria curvirostris nimavirus]